MCTVSIHQSVLLTKQLDESQLVLLLWESEEFATKIDWKHIVA